MIKESHKSRPAPPPFPAAPDRRDEFESQAIPHLQALFRLAMRLTRNEKDAEDLVQDTYLRAYRFYHHFEPGTNVRAWLFRILKNQFLNRLQQEKGVRAMVDLSEAAESRAVLESAFPHSVARTPEQEVMDSVTAGEVEEALAILPPEYRRVVTLALSEEMSYKEIARTMRIPIGTVMSRLHRGRRMLQERLHDYAARRHLVGRATLEAAGFKRPALEAAGFSRASGASRLPQSCN